MTTEQTQNPVELEATNLDPVTSNDESLDFAVSESPVTYILHHGDCDGYLGAVIIGKTLSGIIRYVPVNYGKPFPFEMDAIRNIDTFIIVDFSYKRDILLEINRRVKSLLVLDHHETAKQELEGLPFVVFDTRHSGAMLAWNQFGLGEAYTTPTVELVNAYDLWNKHHPQFSWEEIASYHMAVIDHMSDYNFWATEVLKPTVPYDLITEGRKRFQAYKDYAEDVLHSGLTLRTKIKGENAVIFYCPGDKVSLVSDLIYSGETEDLPITIAFEEKPEGLKISVRTREGCPVLAKDIALFFGGGGHPRAAGAVIPWDKDYDDVPEFLEQCLKDLSKTFYVFSSIYTLNED